MAHIQRRWLLVSTKDPFFWPACLHNLWLSPNQLFELWLRGGCHYYVQISAILSQPMKSFLNMRINHHQRAASKPCLPWTVSLRKRGHLTLLWHSRKVPLSLLRSWFIDYERIRSGSQRLLHSAVLFFSQADRLKILVISPRALGGWWITRLMAK